MSLKQKWQLRFELPYWMANRWYVANAYGLLVQYWRHVLSFHFDLAYLIQSDY